MANTSKYTCRFEKLKLSDPSCAMGASNNSEYVTALATESTRATTFSSPFLSSHSERMMLDMGKCISVEEQIERSKSHWSHLQEYSDSDDDRVAEIDNVEVFKSLQSHSTWGTFFMSFGNDEGFKYYSAGELVVGEKFAEGGQAELYHAQVKWRDPKDNEKDLNLGIEWVRKVFKKGTFLRHLRLQLPQGLLQVYAEKRGFYKNTATKPKARSTSYVWDNVEGRQICIPNG